MSIQMKVADEIEKSMAIRNVMVIFGKKNMIWAQVQAIIVVQFVELLYGKAI